MTAVFHAGGTERAVRIEGHVQAVGAGEHVSLIEWRVVRSVRCVMCVVRGVLCGVWCMMCGVRCDGEGWCECYGGVVWCVWCAVRGVWCLVCGVRAVACGVRGVACGVVCGVNISDEW